MKVKDVLEKKPVQEDSDDTCNLCHLHEVAYDVIEDGFICPHCGELTTMSMLIGYGDGYGDSPGGVNFTVVGQVNSVNPNDNIEKMIVEQCYKCRNHFALMPIKVIWNANHDVYYTGEGYYLQKDFKFNNVDILRKITQYTERIKNGEDLTPQHLALWLNRDIEHSIAEYLKEIGITHYLDRK